MIAVIEQNDYGDEITADIECDGKDCDIQMLGSEYSSWQSMIDTLKGEGWKIRNSSGQWFHYCPDCHA